MMRCFSLYLRVIFFFIATLSGSGVFAQQQEYSQVSAAPGNSQQIRNNTVTVSSSGNTMQSGYNNICEAPPMNYLQGNSWNGDAGSHMFEFASPITTLRFYIIHINNLVRNEIISFYINGQHYALTQANLDTFKVCNPPIQTLIPLHTPLQLTPTGDVTLNTPAGGASSADGIINIYVREGIDSLRVTNNGWGGGAAHSVGFKGIPLIADNNSDSICDGDTLRLYARPDVVNGIYSWEGPNGFTSNEQNPVIPNAGLAEEGMYIATVQSLLPPYYTLLDITHDTTFVKLATPTVDSIADQQVCSGATLHLTATTLPSNANLEWSGPAGFSSQALNPDIPNMRQINEGTYSVTAINGMGCRSLPVSFKVSVIPPALGPATTAYICEGGYYDFRGRTLMAQGSYADTLYGQSSTGCDSVVFLNLLMNPTPKVKITVEKTSDDFCIGDSVRLTAQGAATDSDYNWTINNENIGSGSVKIVGLSSYTNEVTVSGVNGYGCKGADTLTIPSVECCQLWIPSAFSPNGDGLNDQFGAQTRGVMENFRLNIYNRWGQTVFSGYDVDDHWDGTVNGKPADAGTYFYNLTGKCLKGKTLQEKGDVLLIR